jgi:hypothetical protein
MALSDEILSDLKKKGSGKKGPPMRPGNAAEDAADGGADDAQEASYGSDEESAAQDIMDAKDPASFAEALRGFLDICVPKIVDGMKGGGGGSDSGY